MPEKDPNHWLFRLDGPEWLAAAENELAAARRAAVAKQQRAAVAQARRAAGMALNALLVSAPEPAYGRSYMDHIKALGQDPAAPEDVRSAAQRLLAMPLTQEVVVLGAGNTAIAEHAACVLDYVRSLLMPPARG